MRRLIRVLRFFRVVPPVPPLLKTWLMLTTVVAMSVVWWSPHRAADALTPVLLVQMFAAAPGFLLPARRGHYDLLLTGGHSRRSIAIVQWLVSVGPGIGSWLALAALEAVATGGRGASLRTTGTLAAVLLVSSLPWAITIAQPRFAGAIGWLFVLAMFATTSSPQEWPETMLDGRLVAADLAAIVFPPLLVGTSLETHGLGASLPVLMIAGSVLYAVFSLERRDVPLECAQ